MTHDGTGKNRARIIHKLSAAGPPSSARLLCLATLWATMIVPVGAWQDEGRLTPAQTLQRFGISDLDLSADQRYIAMTVTEPVKDTQRTSNIWIFDTRSKNLQHFTASDKSDRQPRWSPDGKRLAFLSNRTGTNQIYLMPLGGGEGEALTRSESSINSFEWSPDGARIAFLSPDPISEEEKERRQVALVIDQDVQDPRLRVIDMETQEVEDLTPDLLRISEFVWMPGGDRLLLSATNHPRRDLNSNRLYSIALKNKQLVDIETPAGPFRNLDISTDGHTLAYLGARSEDGPSPHDLYIRPLQGGSAKNLTGASIDRPIMSFRRAEGGKFLAIAITGFTSTLFSVSEDGRSEPLKSIAVNPGRSFVGGSQTLAFVGETTTRAPELWLSNASGAAEQVTHFNRAWDSIPLAAPEIVSYPSFDGKEIEAALLKPASYRMGTRVPFVVLVHGGPAGRFADRFHAWSQLLVARGYAVLLPNVRGSLGYGHSFLTSNRYDWGGGDWKDVTAGVDYVIDQGIADPERLGIGGWSYGGYMAAWAVTQTNRFKASVSGAPMTDLASEFGTESPGVNIGDTWGLGTPYENLDLFVRRSPVTFVRNVKTPTLLLNGEQDLVDPIGQCQQFYRGLKRYNVETEFVAYPGMGHGPRKEKQQLDVLHRMIGWFEKYLR